MTKAQTTSVYDPVAQTIHWGVALAVLVMFLTAVMMGAPKDYFSPEARGLVFTVHKSTGFLVLLLMVLRVLWFTRHAHPPLPVHLMPHWQVVSAKIVHAALYGLGLLTPLAGWALVSMGSHPFTFYGVFDLPRLPLTDLALQHQYLPEIVEDMHGALATIFASLIVIHVGATILHHFVDRDDVLMRITPAWTHRWLEKLRGN